MSESELALVYLDRFGVFGSSSGTQGRAKTPIHCFELPLLCHKCVEQNALNCLGIDMTNWKGLRVEFSSLAASSAAFSLSAPRSLEAPPADHFPVAFLPIHSLAHPYGHKMSVDCFCKEKGN